MAARKLNQEIEKTFKKVEEGVAIFNGIYDKIFQATNQAQKEKQEDALKKEIKKLQRSRDTIKTWIASSEIKDKKKLIEFRKLIETQMEKFKAVEKEMKTKAYSKEGLQAAAKMDPKEREKAEACDFLSKMVEDLERQVEQLEAEIETLGATVKKSKKDNSKADRIAELEKNTERHKWHQSKLELMLRSLENGVLEVDQVRDLEEDIRYYVENNGEVDFMENDTLYDELDLQEEEDLFGMPTETDRQSSHDAQSLADDQPDDSRQTVSLIKTKSASAVEPSTAAARRPSTQLKSPLPALATLHTPVPPTANGQTTSTTKPAPLPTRTTGEPLKYASAAAAAAASDKSGLGLTSFPAPVRDLGQVAGLSPIPATVKTVPTASPASVTAQPVSQQTKAVAPSVQPIVPPSSEAVASSAPSKSDGKKTPAPEEIWKRTIQNEKSTEEALPPSTPSLTNGDTHSETEEEESIWHLPSSLSDLIESFDAAKTTAFQPLSMSSAQQVFSASGKSFPDAVDSERPQHYRPTNPYPFTPVHYPQDPAHVFDTPDIYGRCDTDTLFYSFYYKQGTYQQYAAAKSLKAASWRFHKQYQTWFQRHEEPKDITEDYEQGTYRFFDYESTWMNRRKADFKFHYKYLEDDC